MEDRYTSTIDSFVDYAGTAGTFIGISKYLKEQDPTIRCFLVEPCNAISLNPDKLVADVKEHRHKIQGGGYSKSVDELPLFDDENCGVAN
jgi:cysteine synthase A